MSRTTTTTAKKKKNPDRTQVVMAPASAKHPVTEGSVGRGVGALIIKYCARGRACDTVEGAAVCTHPHVNRGAIVSVALPK